MSVDLEVFLLRLQRENAVLVTVEEGATGGFGALVLHHLANHGMLDGRCAVRTLTLPDTFIAQASPEDMYEEAKLTARHIAAAARNGLTVARPNADIRRSARAGQLTAPMPKLASTP